MNQNERNEMIEEYGRGFDLLTAALAEVPREAWEFKPAPKEWSIHEVIVHMADSECMGAIRLRKLIAEPGSTLMPYKEATWADALHYRNQSMDDALQIFKLTRQMAYGILKSLSDHVFLQTVSHPEFDEPYNFEKWFHIYVDHVPEHVEQLKKTHRAWKGHEE